MVTHSGPEHSTTTIFRSQPIKPVPITAMKIAEGAEEGISGRDTEMSEDSLKYTPAYAARLTSSLSRDERKITQSYTETHEMCAVAS